MIAGIDDLIVQVMRRPSRLPDCSRSPGASGAPGAPGPRRRAVRPSRCR
jgi:hypothetical protein